MIKSKRGGKYGNGIAGTPHALEEKTWGTKREFIGSGTKSYTFYKEGYGTLIIRAESFKEAMQLAKQRGYKHYRRR